MFFKDAGTASSARLLRSPRASESASPRDPPRAKPRKGSTVESSTVNQSERQAQQAEVSGSRNLGPQLAQSGARRRGIVLGRMLFLGDIITALVAASIALAVFGAASLPDAVIFLCSMGLLWPFAAFSIGLY